MKTTMLVLLFGIQFIILNAQDNTLAITSFYDEETFLSYNSLVYDFFSRHPVRFSNNRELINTMNLYPYDNDFAISGSIAKRQIKVKIWHMGKVVETVVLETKHLPSQRSFMVEFILLALPAVHARITELAGAQQYRVFRKSVKILNELGRMEKFIVKNESFRCIYYLPGMGLNRYKYPGEAIEGYWDVESTKKGLQIDKDIVEYSDVLPYLHKNLIQHTWNFPIALLESNYVPSDFRSDISKLVEPAAARIEVPYAYLTSGLFLLKKNKITWAENAIGAALVSSNILAASQHDHANIRYICYRELSKIEKSRDHRQFADLLDLSSQICEVFLQSSVCQAEAETFYHNVKQVKQIVDEAESQSDAVQIEINRNNSMASLYGLAGFISTDPNTSSQMFETAQKYSINAIDVSRAGKIALRKALQGFTLDARDILESGLLPNEDIALDRFFVGRDVLSFLAFAEDTTFNTKAMGLLKVYSADKPVLSKLLSDLEKCKTMIEKKPVLESLFRQFSLIEAAIHVFELKGKPIPAHVLSKF